MIHFNVPESTGAYENLAGNTDGLNDDLEMQNTDNNRLVFDIMKSKLSKNVKLGVTSQHLAVGQHCISMLLGNGQDIKNEDETHHKYKLKNSTMKQKIGNIKRSAKTDK